MILAFPLSTRPILIFAFQLGMIPLTMYVTWTSVMSLQAKRGLPLGNQVVGWFVMGRFKSPYDIVYMRRLTIVSGAPLLLPFVHRLYPNSHYLHRLVVIFLTFSPTFVILTISYEGLFYVVFCLSLVIWVELEHRIYKHTSSSLPPKSTSQRYRTLTLSDARIALFFFFLLQSAFFSTGNIASISSFSLDSVSRLIPVFNPFSQTALLLFKILVPFAVISANLGILNHRLGVAPSALFMIVMAISDVMTLNFFFMVRDEGSWLDIGTTISHFCIASFFCVFVAGLEFLSEAFIAGIDFGEESVEEVADAVQEKMTDHGREDGTVDVPLNSNGAAKSSATKEDRVAGISRPNGAAVLTSRPGNVAN